MHFPNRQQCDAPIEGINRKAEFLLKEFTRDPRRALEQLYDVNSDDKRAFFALLSPQQRRKLAFWFVYYFGESGRATLDLLGETDAQTKIDFYAELEARKDAIELFEEVANIREKTTRIFLVMRNADQVPQAMAMLQRAEPEVCSLFLDGLAQHPEDLRAFFASAQLSHYPLYVKLTKLLSQFPPHGKGE